MHPPLQGGDGKALNWLLGRFCPATLIDFDLIKAFFLSLLWGGTPGARPAWLFTSVDDDPENGRGVGKSTVAKMGARLVGGHVDVSPNDKMPDVLKRLLSENALGKRILLLDNVKTLKFSWSEIEALITSDAISGHQMYVGEGQRPNTLTTVITLNGAFLSKDLAKRSVPVQVKRPEYDPTWEETTIDFIEANRWAIIGDIIAALKAPAQPLAKHSRWGSWEEGVLARVAEPADCQKVIAERQEAVDDDQEESEIVRDFIVKELIFRQHVPDQQVIFIPSPVAARWANEATDERRGVKKAVSFLKTLNIKELRKGRTGTARGWTWCGERADTLQDPMDLKPRTDVPCF
jgi:hypothetical protein